MPCVLAEDINKLYRSVTKMLSFFIFCRTSRSAKLARPIAATCYSAYTKPIVYTMAATWSAPFTLHNFVNFNPIYLKFGRHDLDLLLPSVGLGRVMLPSTLVAFEAKIYPVIYHNLSYESATLLAHAVFASVNSTEQVRPRTQLSLRNRP